MLFKGFTIFSSNSLFVQQSETILSILVEGHLRNIFLKLFLNRSIDLGGVSFKGFSFLALDAILFSGAERF